MRLTHCSAWWPQRAPAPWTPHCGPHRHKVTFGYIGNCDINGGNDHRAWYVFLPHPGRAGTADDRVGGFATGDLAGIGATRKALNGVAQGVRLARSV